MTIFELIKLEIEKTEKQLEQLKKQLENVQEGKALKVCPICSTYNLHYDVKSGVFICSFC